MFFVCVAVDLSSFDNKISGAIGSAWAPSTLRTRNSQWNRFIDFCHSNDLIPMPAEPRTVARFLVFQARTCKYVTVNNYMSAINRLHAFYGYKINFREIFMIKLVLSGIKRQLGDKSTQKIPLTTTQMRSMYDTLDWEDINVRSKWCALMLSFRSLLRKSNIVPDTLTEMGHVLLRKHVIFNDEGLILHVQSSKTLKYKEHVLMIPISNTSTPVFDVVSMWREFQQMSCF